MNSTPPSAASITASLHARRGDEDARRGRAGLLAPRRPPIAKIGMPSTSVPAFFGFVPATTCVPYVAVAQAVEAALRAGQALVDDLGVLVDEDAHLLVASRELDRGAGRVEHRRLQLQLVGQVGLRGSPGPRRRSCRRGGSRSATSMCDPVERLHDAVGDLFALGDAAEDVDEDRLHLRVVVDDLERVRPSRRRWRRRRCRGSWPARRRPG